MKIIFLCIVFCLIGFFIGEQYGEKSFKERVFGGKKDHFPKMSIFYYKDISSGSFESIECVYSLFGFTDPYMLGGTKGNLDIIALDFNYTSDSGRDTIAKNPNHDADTVFDFCKFGKYEIERRPHTISFSGL